MRIPRMGRRWVLPVLLGGGAAGAVGAGAAAAFEADTVGSYWEGLWWALSLMTTVGFVDGPPSSPVGIATSAVLMIVGFTMLSLVSATWASLLVREDEAPFEQRELNRADEILATLKSISSRLDALEAAPPDEPRQRARTGSNPEPSDP
jgi:voltage-gated potassium channel